MRIRIEGRNLPGSSATWDLEGKTVESPVNGIEFTGPYIRGGPGRRFIYLSSGVVDDSRTFIMFRRAKLMLDAVPSDVARQALGTGVLLGALGLSDDKGNPRCAAVGPSAVEWSAGS